ncbi:MAG: UPF0149 family protein [Gammaproteobacteria bacterium]|nr:UPF0149 family protein [Gammaproteobacteria bacterium]
MEQSRQQVDFFRLNQSLSSARAEADAAEAHGILCGLFCATGQSAKQLWIEQIMGDYDPQNLLLKEALNLLSEMHDITIEQFQQGQFALQLMLRADVEPLEERVQDLGEWCQGFLYGLTIAGIKDLDNLPKDAREVLQDILHISKADFDDNEDEDAGESAYAEVVEYVRIGALVVYGELNHPNQAESKTIH